jgi:hypothetical protein
VDVHTFIAVWKLLGIAENYCFLQSSVTRDTLPYTFTYPYTYTFPERKGKRK